MKEAFAALLEGMNDSFRLTGWIIASMVQTIIAFVNHRDLDGRRP